MKLLMFSTGGATPRPGLLQNDQVFALDGHATLLSVIQSGAPVAPTGDPVPLASVKLHAPLTNPGKLIMIGLNYRDHAIESGMPIPTKPTVFSKFNSSIIGPGDTIVLPKASAQPDYEAEFAFIIGKRAHRAKKEDWRSYVYGYTIINDVSARDWQLATPQWLMGKTCDTFCPMGPWITTADEVADPHHLNIGIKVSGEVLQNSSTKELIFNIGELIEYMSQVMTLEPGDIVSTGTPPGVGMARKPEPRWLRPGDTCEVFIEGLGSLINPVAGE